MRRRHPERLDHIANASIHVFSTLGYSKARITHIADRAGVGPGTIYLYADSKAALFELAILRAAESPSVAHVSLPFKASSRSNLAHAFRSAIEAIANFPQLWLAMHRRVIFQSHEEYEGILLEVATWITRYRHAILLAANNRTEWPALADLFNQIVWRDLTRNLVTYLDSRVRGGHLVGVAEPILTARLTVDALAGALLSNPVHGDSAATKDEAFALVRLLLPPESMPTRETGEGGAASGEGHLEQGGRDKDRR